MRIKARIVPAGRRAFWPAAAAVILSACVRYPEPYAPPEQRAPLEHVELPAIPTMIEMGGPGDEGAIIQDVMKGPTETSWRWAGQNPQVRVHVRDASGLKFRAEFAIADATFRETGPVTIHWTVNGRALDTVRYDKPGNYEFEKTVPAGWVKPMIDNTVGAELDKVYVAKRDGAKLGLILSKIGFTR